MFLAVDIGNSRIKVGLFPPGLRHPAPPPMTDSFVTLRRAPQGAYHGAFDRLLALAGPSARVSRAAICSVVPDATGPLASALMEATGCPPPARLDHETVLPFMALGVREPRTLGADRMAAALGAFALMGAPVAALDLGTASTMEFIAERGGRPLYQGGIIMPGPGLMLRALGGDTASLPMIEPSAPPEGVIGLTTRHCILAGVLAGSAHALHGLLDEARAETGLDYRAIVTGGFAALLRERLPWASAFEPCLTLIGLHAAFAGPRP